MGSSVCYSERSYVKISSFNDEVLEIKFLEQQIKELKAKCESGLQLKPSEMMNYVNLCIELKAEFENFKDEIKRQEQIKSVNEYNYFSKLLQDNKMQLYEIISKIKKRNSQLEDDFGILLERINSNDTESSNNSTFKSISSSNPSNVFSPYKSFKDNPNKESGLKYEQFVLKMYKEIIEMYDYSSDSTDCKTNSSEVIETNDNLKLKLNSHIASLGMNLTPNPKTKERRSSLFNTASNFINSSFNNTPEKVEKRQKNYIDREIVTEYIKFLDYDVSSSNLDLDKYVGRMEELEKKLKKKNIMYTIENVECIKLISNIRDLNLVLVQRGLLLSKSKKLEKDNVLVREYIAFMNKFYLFEDNFHRYQKLIQKITYAEVDMGN